MPEGESPEASTFLNPALVLNTVVREPPSSPQVHGGLADLGTTQLNVK